MKFGILGCGYQCEDGLDERLEPWFKLQSRYNLVFSFISCQFEEYAKLGYKYNNEKTEIALKKFLQVKYLHISRDSLLEHKARNLALKPLLQENCDYIWLLDLSDEYYLEAQINNIIEYINRGENSFESWFSIPFKNYIFSGREYVLGFCPPRIFRVNPMGDLVYKLDSFYWDNDIQYKNPNGIIKSYKQFANKKIPEHLLTGGIKHFTWLHSNGKKKVEYQLKHFNGECSYKWNEEKQELEFNLDFYKKNNLSLPKIYYDN